jgi:hypothetical protein
MKREGHLLEGPAAVLDLWIDPVPVAQVQKLPNKTPGDREAVLGLLVEGEQPGGRSVPTAHFLVFQPFRILEGQTASKLTKKVGRGVFDGEAVSDCDFHRGFSPFESSASKGP